LTAQLKLDVPSIGGKDSMSGSFNELDVPPTLVSFALAMTKASKTLTAAFQKAGSKVIYIPIPEKVKRAHPKWKQLREIYKKVYELSNAGGILSASVVKEGGTAAAIAKMCFGNMIGFNYAGAYDYKTLFAPLSGGLILELTNEEVNLGEVEYLTLGYTFPRKVILLGESILRLEELKSIWEQKLEAVFPSYPGREPIVYNIPLQHTRNTLRPAVKISRPKVFIPVFPGTNCEVDTARAFAKAGAEPNVFVINNLTPAGIEESIREMDRAIRNSQIIMLPGGFSGGDEPDGSGKFIATTFRNPRIADAVSDLLYTREGLILGICNGFQALIKLGLLPYGRITEIGENDPTLTFNTLGRHVSRMVYTRVSSVKSPWLANCRAGDIHTVPVSHGEGRFVASQEMLDILEQNGQIATQYVDLHDIPSGLIEWNPNGSVYAIEGISSPDGRVFGKMGHSERKGSNLYKNVPGSKDQKIFEAGVAYFR
jgi:phosphoribosylformylglycinamidine synthase